MSYLLDTNICIYIIKKKPTTVVNKLSSLPINNVGISSVTLSELYYGVDKSSRPDQNELALWEFLSILTIYSYGERAAREYGSIRSRLERHGKTIGPMDMLIAAHALSLGLVLVTNNEKEFRRVEGLRIENWAKE